MNYQKNQTKFEVFVKKKEYDDSGEGLDQSKNYHKNSKVKNWILWCFCKHV